jgi:hypothetical protein
MWRAPFCLALTSLLLLVGRAPAQDPTLRTATGTVDKVGKDTVTLRPRAISGQFEKSLTLKLTGTSKLSLLTTQKRGNRLVPVQRDADARDLQANQTIAVICAMSPTGAILLAAVAEPATER